MIGNNPKYPFKSNLFFLGLVILASIIFLAQCVTVKDTISYNDHVRPIFNKKCLPCHGGVKQLGGFSLLFEKEAFAEADSGNKAIIRGNASQSELYKRIIHHDPEERMPKDGPSLTEEEKEIIAKWIDEGAEWEEHWSYIPPIKSDLPQANSDWVNNEIDNFILDKLQSQDLTPAKEADK